MFRLFIAFAVVAAFCVVPASAQNAPSTNPHASDTSSLFHRWQQTQDLDEKLALGERLLASESNWPPNLDPADVRFEVGSAFLARGRGLRADNVEAAILNLQAALDLWSGQGRLDNAAVAHNNLGMAYWGRIKGARADNQEKAAAHFEAALLTFSRDRHPEQWAQLQNNLAIVYWNRTRGVRADNIETAIGRFEAALGVLTREHHARLWAAAQNNLASAYRDRKTGDRAENIERAIAYLEGARTVFTREAYPFEWAQAQNNLAICYRDRVRGAKASNHAMAIAAFKDALSVLTPVDHRQEWGLAQHNLGVTYGSSVSGDRAGNLRESIGALKAAVGVFGPAVDPLQHLRTARLLAKAYGEAGEWDSAAAYFSSAREAFLTLFGEGLDEGESRALLADAGPMFADAAFAAIQRAKLDLALELANEGRSKMLSVALKLQTLNVAPAVRERIEELRRSIRAAQVNADTAQALDRAAAVENLTNLRQELLKIVKASFSSGEASSALGKAHRITAGGGVLVVPIISSLGAGVLIVADPDVRKTIRAVDLPTDTQEKLFVLLRGPRNEPQLTGWLGAYFITQLDGDELNRRWPEWLEALDTLGGQLWNLLGGPLDAALQSEQAKPSRLVVMPAGELGILPLGLAQAPGTSRRLIDTYEIVYAPSLDVLAHASDQAPIPSLAVIVNPTGDLPGAESEGKLVASHFSPDAQTILGGDKATVEGVLAALPGKSHWHFASHGTFSWQDARQSALIMHGGKRLTVQRLLEIEGLGRPRLVVLSACETGLYELTTHPDEFIGLPGAFAALGAGGVLSTLWPVSDDATALLVAKFYEHYMEAREPPPTALHRAQLWLRNATEDELASYTRLMTSRARAEHLQPDRRTIATQRIARAAPLSPSNSAPPAAEARSIRPYEHPYFWAAFTYTGR